MLINTLISRRSLSACGLTLLLLLTACSSSGQKPASPTTIDPKIEELQLKVDSLEEKINSTTTTQKPARYKIFIESYIDAADTIGERSIDGGYLLRCGEYSLYKWSDTGEEFYEARFFKVRVYDSMPSNPGGSCRGS
jgi:hypothetical protein